MAPSPNGFKSASQSPVRQPKGRAREALKHLPPWMPKSLPTPEHVLTSSPDPTLNAFAQLVTFRLNVDRALVSLIDDGEQYILAEATKTTPLQPDRGHEADEGLILGTVAIPKERGLCDCALLKHLERGVWVVKDIHDDNILCGRDFARSRPEIKFYAACPISVRGLRIGVLCVYDRVARDSVAPSEEKFLIDTAAMIAQHLESTKTHRAHDRSSRILAALDSVMRQHDNGGSHNGELANTQHEESPLPTVTPALEVESSNAARLQHHLPQEVRPAVSTETLTATNLSGPKHQAEPITTPDRDWKSSLKKDELNDASEFLRYTGSLLLDGFNADGVLFYDAGSRVFSEHALRSSLGSLSEYDDSDSEDGLPADSSTLPSRLRTSQGGRPSSSACEVLASSVSKRYPRSATAAQHLRDKDLQQLLRSFPTGKILNLEEDGLLAGSSGDDGEDNNSPRNDALRARYTYEPLEVNGFPANLTISTSRDARGIAARHLRKSRHRLSKAFPEARSVAFFPLWDSHRERWFAGGFAYSCNDRRLIFTEEDLRVLRAFSLCVMGELGRRDFSHSEAQKEAFLSLVSHELRTPLHGILGNCELLREVGLTPFQTTLLDTVEGCGHSLLDVINHIIDYSATAAKDERQRRGKIRAIWTGLPSEEDMGLATSDATIGVHAQEDIDLVAVTEEIIDGLASEMQLAADARQGYERRLSLSLHRRQDLNRSDAVMIYAIQPRDNWVLRLRTGVFRRILTNLVGNSIKFTSEGTIRVTLHRDDPKDGSSVCTVTLQVADTGRGISDDYMKHHLYEQFQQEDPHAIGSGLGLSIVRSIVDELNGTVDVQSQKGIGTTVTVTFPCGFVARLLPLNDSRPLQYLHNTLGKVKEAARGITACFIHTNTLHGEGPTLKSLGYSVDSIAKICTEWFDLKIEHSDKLLSGSRRINFVDESYLYSKSFSDMLHEIESSADLSDPERTIYTPTVFIGAASFVATLYKDPTFKARDGQFFVTNP